MNTSTMPNQDVHVPVADAVNTVLVDVLDLALQARQAHWAVTGPQFHALHQMFDELSTGLMEQADEIAERVLALNHVPDGRLDTIKRASHLEPFPAGAVGSAEAASLIRDRLATVAAEVRKQLEYVGEQDPPTEDILVALTQYLEKQAWMFRAQAS